MCIIFFTVSTIKMFVILLKHMFWIKCASKSCDIRLVCVCWLNTLSRTNKSLKNIYLKMSHKSQEMQWKISITDEAINIFFAGSLKVEFIAVDVGCRSLLLLQRFYCLNILLSERI